MTQYDKYIQNRIMNFDFATLYPTTMVVYTKGYLDAIERKIKIAKILKKLDDDRP
jgi:hypothetical protein